MTASSAIRKMLGQVTELERKLAQKKGVVVLFSKAHLHHDTVLEKHCEVFPDDRDAADYVSLVTHYSRRANEYEELYLKALDYSVDPAKDYRMHAAHLVEREEAETLGKMGCLLLWGRRLLEGSAASAKAEPQHFTIDNARNIMNGCGLPKAEVVEFLRSTGIDIDHQRNMRMLDIGYMALRDEEEPQGDIGSKDRSAPVQPKKYVLKPHLYKPAPEPKSIFLH